MGNDEATCYVGGLSSRMTEALLKEMFTQVGPVAHLTLKKTDTHSFALIEFKDEDSVPFAIEVMDGVKLFNMALTVKPRNNTKQEEAWKKAQQTRRNGGGPEVYLPQLERGDRGREPPRNELRPAFLNPPIIPGMPLINMPGMLPPPPPPPSFGAIPLRGYATPSPSSRMQPDFKIGRLGGNRDNWHTPPDPNMLNPQIPPQYLSRQNLTPNARNDIRNDMRGVGDRRFDDRGSWSDERDRRSHNDHRQRYNSGQQRPQQNGGRRY